jgi:hypothetical protein
MAKFIKGKSGTKTEEPKDNFVNGELIKIIEFKDILAKEGKIESIKELSNKLDNIEQDAVEVY